MFKKMIVFPTLILFVMALPIVIKTAWAKGPPDRVEISGPGLDHPIVITDPDFLQAFSVYVFENIHSTVDDLKFLDQGYVLTRYVERDSELIAWDELVYYPRPFGLKGYVYYSGQLESRGTPYDEKWYLVSTEGDVAMHRILVERIPEFVLKDIVEQGFRDYVRQGLLGNCRGADCISLST